MVLTLGACQKVESQASRPDPLPQDTFVQVYFNHAESADYTEPYRKITRPGDDLEQLIVEAIASAESTVDVAVQELRLPNIAQALVERHQAGIKVRVILENTYNRPWSDFSATEVAKFSPREQQHYNEALKLIDDNGDGKLSPDEINQRDALVILRKAGVPLIDDTADGTKGSGLMHHKFLVVDGRLAIVTSANFTTSGIHGDMGVSESRGNANNLLKIESPELADLLTQEFNWMWGDGPGGQPDSKFGINKPSRPVQQVILGNSTIAVHFSPNSTTEPWNQTSNGLIRTTLSQATKSVNLALFVFAEQRLVNTLEASHQQGISVKALIDSGFAYRYYSDGLDMMGTALSNKCQYDADNRPWQSPLTTVGVPQLPKGDVLHHKFAIADGEKVITGSHNWSKTANINNDETLLVIDNPTVAAHFEQEFARLYSNAVLGVPATLQQKIQTEMQKCPRLEVKKTDVSGQLVNLNTASQAELEALPGIGQKLAARIITQRQQKPFTSLKELDAVPGVGPSLLENLEGRVTW
ncbi:DUF655 domain-containing protein [Lyngbya aestuarii]|uniref:DUF655 domain-containing protein n=1 Tax=Lyngbya aestuarii TaxID=118322 RepID=UPI00403D96F5